jgi:3-hydroxybutyryl-CoA dehydrogenase
MRIIVLASEELKKELTSQGVTDEADVIWVKEAGSFLQYKNADAYIDLLFENTKHRVELLKQLLPCVIIVNSVVDTLSEIDESFIRINGWPTLLKGAIVEASALKNEVKVKAGAVFSVFGKRLEWLEDTPGFISARVISMIINEAYFALREDVSTPADIDIAMKLGTAYPYGPFEWGNEIGLQNIVDLLIKLSKTQRHYTPCELLVQETDRAI